MPVHASGGRTVPEAVAGLQESLTRLLRDEDSETARIELTRISESRQTTVAMLHSLLALAERIERTETMVQEIRNILKKQEPQKEWYTVAELAEVLGKPEFTVREWCLLGRVHAEKRECGRGNSQKWIVSHAEIRDGMKDILGDVFHGSITYGEAQPSDLPALLFCLAKAQEYCDETPVRGQEETDATGLEDETGGRF